MTGPAAWSIRRKLLLAIVAVSLAGIGLLSVFAATQEARAQQRALGEELRSLARLLASRSEAALRFEDASLAEENAAALIELGHVVGACIYDAGGRLFAGMPDPRSDWRCPSSGQVVEGVGVADAIDAASLDGEGLSVQAPIGRPAIGSVLVRGSLLGVQQRLAEQWRLQLAVAGALALVSVLLALWLQRLITAPIEQMRDIAAAVMRSGDFSQRAPLQGGEEIAELADSFNRMLARIEVQQGELSALNADLEDLVRQRTADLSAALDTLKRAQDELIRSEKMAALGSLVAGLAHELNTPVGNALTVASTIADRSRELRAAVDANSLRRSQLSDYVATIEEAAALVERSLQRARELVSSFKQVAVDQASAKRRRFELSAVIEETLTTLRPGLRGRDITLNCEVPAGLWLDSYPGALGQVITNLINNAVLHGFSGRERGRVRITAAAVAVEPDSVRLVIEDDGVGMSEEVRRRAFDPFFTTRLGQGGSGLGLSLVFNMVTGVLGGRVDLRSRPGSGCVFELVLPRVAPVQPGSLWTA